MENKKEYMDLTIYRSETGSLIEQNALPQLLQRLPASLHARAHRYKSELSAYNYVIGRLLLERGLESLGLDNNLENIEIQEMGSLLSLGFISIYLIQLIKLYVVFQKMDSSVLT